MFMMRPLGPSLSSCFENEGGTDEATSRNLSSFCFVLFHHTLEYAALEVYYSFLCAVPHIRLLIKFRTMVSSISFSQCDYCSTPGDSQSI